MRINSNSDIIYIYRFIGVCGFCCISIISVGNYNQWNVATRERYQKQTNRQINTCTGTIFKRQKINNWAYLCPDQSGMEKFDKITIRCQKIEWHGFCERSIATQVGHAIGTRCDIVFLVIYIDIQNKSKKYLFFLFT